MNWLNISPVDAEHLDQDIENPGQDCPELPEPRIIPRAQHNLSRKNIDKDAVKVLYRLHNHGFKGYLVGGGVRDLLLDKRPKDFDVGTDARPGEIKKLFRNSRVIGRRFRLVQVFFHGGKVIEVSTFRRASDPECDEVLSANNTFGTPAEDALRRDLTINALFYNIADYSLVDYVGGLADLRAGLIRGVGDPAVRFLRDPVRVMRAIRHAARAGFNLTGDTLAAVIQNRDNLQLCPTSRIRDELMRDLGGGSSAAWLELAHRTGVFYSLLPSLEPHFGDDDSPLRQRARKLLGQIDAAWAQGQPLLDSVILAALFWPVLEALAAKRKFPPHRAGRVAWGEFMHQSLLALAKPVAFTKRNLERCRQMIGIMGFVRSHQEDPSVKLPKKIAQRGYFEAACQLAGLLGFDLKKLAGAPQNAPSGSKRSRRPRRPRRRRRRPKANALAEK